MTPDQFLAACVQAARPGPDDPSSGVDSLRRWAKVLCHTRLFPAAAGSTLALFSESRHGIGAPARLTRRNSLVAQGY